MNTGERPVVVFLRGLIRSRYHWNGFPDRFRDDFEVIEPELPGNGYLAGELTPKDIPAMMRSVREQVRYQFIGPVHIIAISMGGMIATEWARRFPDEVAGMHLINTSLANMSLPWQRMDAASFFHLLSCLGQRERLEKVIYRKTINRDVSESETRQWLEFARVNPLQWRNIFVQLIAASRYKGPMEAPIDHVWFYNALHDRLVSPWCTTRIARTWNKPLLTHPEAGHDLPVDAPDWLETSIRTNMTSGLVLPDPVNAADSPKA